MTSSKFRAMIITVERQPRLNEREVINLESNKYIHFSDDENTTISETALNEMADDCINHIKQELFDNGKPCTFEICMEISERIKQRLLIRTF